MKKILIGFICTLAALLSLTAFHQTAQAATNPGLSVVANLEKGANAGKLKVNASDLNQVRNYVNSSKAAVTQYQADVANDGIDQIRGIIENSAAKKATTYTQVAELLNSSQKNQIRQIVYAVAKKLGLSVMFGQGTNALTGANTTTTNEADATDGSGTTDGSNTTDGTKDATTSGDAASDGTTAATTDGDGSLAPTITDKNGKVVYQPASTTGSGTGTTVVKQTGRSYLTSIITLASLVVLAGLGLFLAKRNQRVEA